MTAIELKNNLLRMIAETNDPDKLQLMVEWFGIVRGEKDWWVEISEKERKLILEGEKQIAEGKRIPSDEVRNKVQKLLMELRSARNK